MEKRTITINEGLAWMKTLKARQGELISLRDQNSERHRRYLGANADKEVVREPLYDPKHLDKMIGAVAREIRILDAALKKTNAVTEILGYSQDEAALGEL